MVRLRTLNRAARGFLVEDDAVALGNQLTASFMPKVPLDRGQKLAMFSEWFTTAAYQLLVGDGAWMRPFLTQAWESGHTVAAKMTGHQLNSSLDSLYLEAATRELQGIADALIQQATRAVSLGLAQQRKPTALWRLIVIVFRKITKRLALLTNTSVVQLHNVGRLDNFDGAGIDKVNAMPEGRRPHLHDAAVNVQTAGDQFVCAICEDIAANGPYDIDEAYGLIPAHGDCRCAFVPAEDFELPAILAALEEIVREMEE